MPKSTTEEFLINKLLNSENQRRLQAYQLYCINNNIEYDLNIASIISYDIDYLDTIIRAPITHTISLEELKRRIGLTKIK